MFVFCKCDAAPDFLLQILNILPLGIILLVKILLTSTVGGVDQVFTSKIVSIRCKTLDVLIADESFCRPWYAVDIDFLHVFLLLFKFGLWAKLLFFFNQTVLNIVLWFIVVHGLSIVALKPVNLLRLAPFRHNLPNTVFLANRSLFLVIVSILLDQDLVHGNFLPC